MRELSAGAHRLKELFRFTLRGHFCSSFPIERSHRPTFRHKFVAKPNRVDPAPHVLAKVVGGLLVKSAVNLNFQFVGQCHA